MLSLLHPQARCIDASLVRAACEWSVEETSNHLLLNGLLDMLAGSGIDVQLMQFFTAKDLALLSMVNRRLRRMCKVFCVARLRCFLGLSSQKKSEDLQSLPIVQHFLDAKRTSLPHLLHVVAHCRDHTCLSKLSLGEGHTAVVKRLPNSRTRVFVFGEGTHGQLGLGKYANCAVPTSVDLSIVQLCPEDDASIPLGDVIAVACGRCHTALLTACGRLITFGANEQGQLGDDCCESRCFPEVISTRFDDFGQPIRYEQIVAGKYYTAAITNEGRVAVFGRGLDCYLWSGYSLHNGDIDIANGERIVQIAAGQNHLLMLSSSNRVFAVGSGSSGKLGIAANLIVSAEEDSLQPEHRAAYERIRIEANCSVPSLVESSVFADEVVVQVAAGGNHSALVTAGGQLFMWGGCGYGELGLGKIQRCVPRPTQVLLSKDSFFALHISCGRAHTAVLTSCGKVVTFGDGGHRQGGQQSHFFACTSPQQICLGELERHSECLSTVVCGGRHSAIMDAEGDLFTFGDPLCTGRVFRSQALAQKNKHLPKFVRIC